MEAILLMGLQAAGKSTFFQQQFAATHLRISLDMLRTRARERSLLAWCITHQQRFVVDNTNPSVAERAVYLNAANAAGFRCIGYWLQSSIAESVARNVLRDGRARVPEIAIGATAKRFEVPHRREGFAELFQVTLQPDGTWEIGPLDDDK